MHEDHLSKKIELQKKQAKNRATKKQTIKNRAKD